MARNPVRDERQGDLCGATPPPAKPARRTSLPKPVCEESKTPEPMLLATLGAKATRPEIAELLDDMPDQELAYLAVEATRLVKRRLVRGQGKEPRHKQAAEGYRPLMTPFARSGVS
jgi:hypothetical protein